MTKTCAFAPDMTLAERRETGDDMPTNPMTERTIGDVINARLGRRDFLKGTLGVTAASAALASPLAIMTGSREAMAAMMPFTFEEIAHGVDETHHVAPGYDADVLLRWGDPILKGAPPFDPADQTAEAQLGQFGYNNDFVGFAPLPIGSGSADHGLLCVNHEYTSEEVMFPNLPRQGGDFADMTAELVAIEMAAHGGSVVEVRRGPDGKWTPVEGSDMNRRITALETEMRIAGPAAGNERMKTAADPAGARVIGTLNNCAGGMTPWGTWLMAEENFHNYFWGDLAEDHPEHDNYRRYGVPESAYAWGRYHDRFDITKEPNEANRFGWIVEVDPYDPASMPVKRTALGRFKHEGAANIVNRDGRVVVYCGDDQRFDYLYKFVSNGTYDPANRAANMGLLDDGILHVARFEDDGTVHWLPLVHGSGPLTEGNDFRSAADVMIETRRAADLLGATPMDRPEDVEPNPATGHVYVMLTNNTKRTDEQIDAANPRANNAFGHVVEIRTDGDHASLIDTWDVLVRCGDPAKNETFALWNSATTANGWFAAPDNCAIDGDGRLWVATDQGSGWANTGTADGVWAMETAGAGRGTGRMFFRVPLGAEMCGPCFTGDDETLFVAVQHPATDGVKNYPGFGRNSTYEDPATRWPDFDPSMPPRPSVVAITKRGGGRIGS